MRRSISCTMFSYYIYELESNNEEENAHPFDTNNIGR